jgi:hypothetical protein
LFIDLVRKPLTFPYCHNRPFVEESNDYSKPPAASSGLPPQKQAENKSPIVASSGKPFGSCARVLKSVISQNFPFDLLLLAFLFVSLIAETSFDTLQSSSTSLADAPVANSVVLREIGKSPNEAAFESSWKKNIFNKRVNVALPHAFPTIVNPINGIYRDFKRQKIECELTKTDSVPGIGGSLIASLGTQLGSNVPGMSATSSLDSVVEPLLDGSTSVAVAVPTVDVSTSGPSTVLPQVPFDTLSNNGPSNATTIAIDTRHGTLIRLIPGALGLNCAVSTTIRPRLTIFSASSVIKDTMEDTLPDHATPFDDETNSSFTILPAVKDGTSSTFSNRVISGALAFSADTLSLDGSSGAATIGQPEATSTSFKSATLIFSNDRLSNATNMVPLITADSSVKWAAPLGSPFRLNDATLKSDCAANSGVAAGGPGTSVATKTSDVVATKTLVSAASIFGNTTAVLNKNGISAENSDPSGVGTLVTASANSYADNLESSVAGKPFIIDALCTKLCHL